MKHPTHELEKAVHTALTKYIKLFGLENWRFEPVRWNLDETWDNEAAIARTIGQHHVTLTVSAILDADRAEEIIVHELIHIVLNDVSNLYDQYRCCIPESVQPIWDVQWESTLEILTDHLTQIFKSVAR